MMLIKSKKRENPKINIIIYFYSSKLYIIYIIVSCTAHNYDESTTVYSNVIM